MKSIDDISKDFKEGKQVEINEIKDDALIGLNFIVIQSGENKIIKVLERGYRITSLENFSKGERVGEWISENELKKKLKTILVLQAD